MTNYAAETTMRTARDAYFAANDFGADGGYGSPWVDISLGPIPLGFPNWSSRKEAVAYHDLHHIVTGYQTDWPGELEIAAWELGAGCKGMVAAWLLNLPALAGGALVMPRRTLAAFVRGRRSRSLYGESLDAVLALSVGAARSQLGVPDDARPRRASDYAAFAAAALAGTVLGAVLVPLVGPPFVLVGWAYRRLAGRKRTAG